MFIYLFIMLGVVKSFGRMEMEGIGAYVRTARASLGAWTRGELNTAVCFGIAVTLWILPSLVGIVLGKEAEAARFLSSRLNEGAVAMLAASFLFILPVSFKEREFTMSWAKAVRIDWGTILLFGGGLSLGSLMFSTGLAEHLGAFLTGLTGAEKVWSLTAMGTAFAIILSEATSPALGACLGASFGFMLPVSTPPNAIVYGSGYVPILAMVRNGIFFDIGGFFIIMAGLRILCPLMGWT
jgi:sodium-dependent dicarboxylate transporter 2/3/5